MGGTQAGEKKITILVDGPYEVSSSIPLEQQIISCDGDGISDHWEKGKTYDGGKDKVYHLCRCGHSREKPFCDGTHEDAGFCGREKADRPEYEESAKVYKGAGLNLMDDESLCVGARFCDKGESIWRTIRKSDDPEAREAVIREACNCPGGRLTIVDKGGTEVEPDLAPGIGVVEDPVNDFRGPLWVRGGVEIEGAHGEKYQVRNRVALCRCGESSNMPYCDGSHYNCEHMAGLDE